MILFTPVYHAFARIIRAAGREVVRVAARPRDDGRYAMDFAACAAPLTGRERMVDPLLAAQPRRPGLDAATNSRAVADFCRAHDLVLVSDEIHHDLVLPGQPPRPCRSPRPRSPTAW